MLSIKALRNLWLLISLGLSTLLFPHNSFAALIDVQQKNDIVYFLFAAPNKIVRYDLNGNSFLSKLTLDKVPTAFHVNDSAIYTSYEKELYKSALDGTSASKIYEDSYNINSVSTIGDYIYFVNNDSKTHTLSSTDHTKIGTQYSNRDAKSLKASTINNAIYAVVDTYSRGLYKMPVSDTGMLSNRLTSNFNASDMQESRVYLHPNEDKVYTDTGFIYSAEDLSFNGSLTGRFVDMTFLDNKPVVIRENILSMYSENDLDSKSVTLDHSPSHVAAKNQIITSFVTTNSLVMAHQTHISLLTKPRPLVPNNPATTDYQAELITTDNDNMVYLVDTKNPAIHRRKATEKEFAHSWGLIEAPNWITYSESHKRLYLGYESGKITYFDTSLTTGSVETHFISLTHKIRGLVSAGQYLYAKDHQDNSNTNNYSINKNGRIIGISTNGEASTEYVWNSLNDHLFQINSNYITWSILSSSDGSLSNTGRTGYTSGTQYKLPLRLSPNGQVLLLGSGEIVGTENKTVLNNIDNAIDDATWINGNLVTIKADTSTLQFWQEDYILTAEHQLSKTTNTRLFNLKEKLLIIKQSDTRPIFIYTDVDTISDSDEDSINDFDDNCEFISNLDQKDFDQDNRGDICDDDSDNDLIPNSIETAAGLDILNKDDALLDLDGDNFSNLVEYLYSTDINDETSKPAIISELNETFDHSIPLGMYRLDSAHQLLIGKEEDNYYLSTPTSNTSDQATSILYTAEFEQGLLSLRYGVLSSYFYNYSYKLDIIIDGELEKSESVYSNWRTTLINLEKGVHTLEFKFSYSSSSSSSIPLNALIRIDDLTFGLDADSDAILDDIDNCPAISNYYQQDSDGDGLGNECDNDPYGQDKDADGFGDNKDNCPDIYNPDQLNIDNDYYGDACDDVDDRPSDVDQDGIPDYSDNCPNTANPEQKNFDHDYFGDLCDLDTDNDGLLNSIEDQYDFLNSFDPTDALLDYDNDGASNQYELNNNLSADKVDTFEDINLLDYYPVGILDYFYVTDNRFIRTSMTTTEIPGRFKVSSTNDIEIIIERRSSGIYLISSTYTDFDMTFLYENFQILPSSLKPGHVFTSNNSGYQEGSSDVLEGENTFYITNVGEKAWRGRSYPSVTLMINGIERTFLKGIGEASIQQLELDSVNFDFIEAPEVVAPEKSKSKAGALSPFIFFFFTIMAIATRIRRHQ